MRLKRMLSSGWKIKEVEKFLREVCEGIAADILKQDDSVISPPPAILASPRCTIQIERRRFDFSGTIIVSITPRFRVDGTVRYGSSGSIDALIQVRPSEDPSSEKTYHFTARRRNGEISWNEFPVEVAA
jgi:hypothetical protein